MNKETIAALHAGMEAVQSGNVAPGRVWVVKKRPDGTVERRQVDAKAYQRERAAASRAAGSVLPARSRMGVSQDRFAELLGLSPATVRNWEQGRRKPTGALLKLLDIAERYPEIFVGKSSGWESLAPVEIVRPCRSTGTGDGPASPGRTKPGKGRGTATMEMVPNLQSKTARAPAWRQKKRTEKLAGRFSGDDDDDPAED